MGMGLHTMLYLQEFGLLSSERNKILDIGPQNVYFATERQIRQFVQTQGQAVSDEIFENEIKRLVYFSTPRPEERTTLFSEISDLTTIEYNSFDVCPGLKTDLLDMNYEFLPEKFREYYDVVLNFGTTEHIVNQWNCFEIMHDAAKVGGTIYHQLPATGYLDHGYFTYTPVFFRDLAAANDYEILDTFFTPAGRNDPVNLGIDVRSDASISVPHSGGLTIFDRRVPCFNVHVLLRKQRGGRFRCALEIATAHAAVNQTMAWRYATDDELRAQLADLKVERDTALAGRNAAVAERDGAIEQLNLITASRSWRVTKPLRDLISRLRASSSS